MRWERAAVLDRGYLHSWKIACRSSGDPSSVVAMMLFVTVVQRTAAAAYQGSDSGSRAASDQCAYSCSSRCAYSDPLQRLHVPFMFHVLPLGLVMMVIRCSANGLLHRSKQQTRGQDCGKYSIPHKISLLPHLEQTAGHYGWRAAKYIFKASSREGIGGSPSRSIRLFDNAENLGRRAAVRYSRSLVAVNWGCTPAA
jgi:hypothetical protein